MNTIYTLIAQAYSCDAYGAGNYNECATTEPTSESGNNAPTSSNSATTNTSQATDATGATDSTPSVDTSTTDTSTSTTSTSTPTHLPETMAAKAASIPWSILIPIFLVIAVLFALLIAFLRRRHREQPPSGDFHQPM